jgi:hypothetical protein
LKTLYNMKSFKIDRLIFGERRLLQAITYLLLVTGSVLVLIRARGDVSILFPFLLLLLGMWLWIYQAGNYIGKIKDIK